MHIPSAPGHVRPPGLLSRAAVASAQHRLAARTAARIGVSGLLDAPCRSRVLETALALRLLDRTGSSPERAELARFLETRRHAEPAGTLDHVLAGCALSGNALPARLAESALAGFDHFTSSRKQNLLHAVAVIFGGPRSGTAKAYERTGLHPWASAVATACEVVIGGTATAEQRAELLAAQQHGSVWDGHLLCHLLTAHALQELPGTTAIVREAVRKLLGTRRPDGGIPFIERLDVFCSAIAGLGLIAAGDPGRRSEVLAEEIAGLQIADGGWAYATGVGQADVDTTAVSLELLTAVDARRYAAEIDAGLGYLHRIRGDDGGFPTYLRGAAGEVAMTAAAANALHLDDRGTAALADAVEFIARRQYDDGSFEPGWSASTANTACRVLLALDRAAPVTGGETIRSAATRTRERLIEDQNPDGGWGHRRGEHSDPISTAFALIGLARSRSAAVLSGVRFLLGRQRADGGFVSRPDSTGPRGFVYDVPVLADLYPLLAFGHLAGAERRLARSPQPLTGSNP